MEKELLVTPAPKFYIKGQDALEAMLAACEKATKTIDLEQYIFENDTIGLRFIEILRKKSQNGVKVRVLCDAVGSWFLYNSNLPAAMRADGIEVRFFNAVSPWRIHNIFSWFFRDHRKILVIDQKIGFTGGVGIRDDIFTWRDTNVEVHNEIVGEMLATFNILWTQVENRHIVSRLRKARQYARGFQFVTNSPYFRKRFLYFNVIDALRSARQYAYLTTPYFVPDARLTRVLKLAVRRGVDVRLIVPKNTIEPFVGLAMHSYYEGMLRAGVKIFEYDACFLHAKTIVIDDEWATMGSFNLDSLSFLYNYEANIISTDQTFIQSLKKHFLDDLHSAPEITFDSWLERPLIQKLQEMCLMPFRGFF